ncbi:hypothetical protein Taro_006860 [Colocasia esculenta]|uniref:DUF4216 domain-containing protein n=1 Tax=Colocasia esculenta TaxID=4460 RepID=A0A843TYL5_COLES|nr:hypothetical protein [Colocasia esculenta]
MALPEEVTCLARGPKHDVVSYQAFFTNGYKFETKSMDISRVTQNSGVVTIGDHENIFYGVLQNIIEFQFGTMPPIVLFKCKWYDMNVGVGLLVDEFKLTSANTTRSTFEDEPFIFPSQVQQVYYSDDPLKLGWSVFCQWKPRDTFEVPINETQDEENEDATFFRGIEPTMSSGDLEASDNDVSWVRRELGIGTRIDDDLLTVAKKKNKKTT